MCVEKRKYHKPTETGILIADRVTRNTCSDDHKDSKREREKNVIIFFGNMLIVLQFFFKYTFLTKQDNKLYNLCVFSFSFLAFFPAFFFFGEVIHDMIYEI